MPFCPNCGTQNPDTAKFCISCGAALAGASSEQKPPHSPLFSSQPVAIGSKVTFTASDGKTYTGTILDMQGDQYKIKYDAFNYETWLKQNQFTVVSGSAVPPVYPAIPQSVNPQQAFQNNASSSFITHLGFWACILIIIGFFTPWLNYGYGNITAFDIVKAAGPIMDASDPDGIGVLILVCISVIIISSLVCLLYIVGVGIGRGAFILFKLLPLLALIATVVYLIIKSQNKAPDYEEYEAANYSAWRILGVGIYLTLAGSLILAISKGKR